VSLRVVPLTLAQANALVERWHRHHAKVLGHRFSIGLIDSDTDEYHGAAIIGRPVAREVEQYAVAEVTRLVTDGVQNGCSMLLGAASRAAQAMGFEYIQTYTLSTEPGTSLRASGWVSDHAVKGRAWTCPSRPRDGHLIEDKTRWVKQLRKDVK
jgi:hypothetical protein